MKPIDANPDANGANCDANEEACYERILDMPIRPGSIRPERGESEGGGGERL